MVSVAALGATPVLLQQSRSVNQKIFSSAQESCFHTAYFDLFSKMDAVIDVFAYQPVTLGVPLEEEQMHLYRRYMSRLFRTFMACKRFTQIRVPTKENAAESNLDPNDFIERMNKAYDIDYELLYAACEREVKNLENVHEIEVHTGMDAVLYLNLTGRVWRIDAGDGDIPCGEIYIAPLEKQTNGNVFFETFYLDDIKYADVTLRILNGEVIDCSHRQIAKYFAQLPRENRVVCELGIGMNSNVTSLCGYTVLDEKMAGTFHIAVGANTMFGGNNKASDHIDFVGRGKIEVVT